jgi:hypothetical protein
MGPISMGTNADNVLEARLGDQDDVLDPHGQVLVGDRNRRLDGEELARLERLAANGDVVHFHPQSVAQAVARALVQERAPCVRHAARRGADTPARGRQRLRPTPA